jgi:hypothetical protein
MAAAASLAADGVRADFAIRQQTSAVELLSSLAGQVDCRDTWENETHRIVRLPRANVSIPVDHQLTCGDYFSEGPGVSEKVITRSSSRESANRITTTYAPYAPSGSMSKTFEIEDLASQATNLGLMQGVLELDLVQDEVSAGVVAQRKLERIAYPRWIFEVDVPIYGLSFRPGDLVSSNDPEFAFEVGEITQVNLNTSQLKRARIQVVVWKK